GSGIARKLVADNPHHLVHSLLGSEPAQGVTQIEHSPPYGDLIGVTGKFQEPAARVAVGGDARQRLLDPWHLALSGRQRSPEAFDAVEEHPDLGHIALEQLMNKLQLL